MQPEHASDRSRFLQINKSQGRQYVMSSYENPNERLTLLQKKLSAWKSELRDDIKCIPRLEVLRDEYKQAADYLQDNAGEIEEAFRELVEYRLKYENSLTSPGLLGVLLSYLVMPFCLGTSLIHFLTKRTERAFDLACDYFDSLKEKAVINTDICQESLYIRMLNGLGSTEKIVPMVESRRNWSTPPHCDVSTWAFSAVYLTVLSMLLFSVADEVYACFPAWLVASKSITAALQIFAFVPSESLFYGLLVLLLPYFLGRFDGKLFFLFLAPLLGLLLLQALHWLPVGVSAVYYLIAGLYVVAFCFYLSDSSSSPIAIWRDNRRLLKNESIKGDKKELLDRLYFRRTNELNIWHDEIQSQEDLIESTQNRDIPRIQNKIEKLQSEINVENARWESLSEVNKLAEIKAVEEIKTLRNKQENDDLVAKELIESSKRQAAAAEQQAIAACDAARAQEQQAAAALDAARDAARAQEQQAAAARDQARTAAEAANTCVYCRVRGAIGPCHKSPHGQHRFG
jgi:hypothetical protein